MSAQGEALLTRADLAEALECFWNAALGGQQNELTPVGCMAEGIAAVAYRLRELDVVSAPASKAAEVWRENLRAYQAALRMIREWVEQNCGVGAMPSEEAVLCLNGPEPHHEAKAIIAALGRYCAPSPAAAVAEGAYCEDCSNYLGRPSSCLRAHPAPSGPDDARVREIEAALSVSAVRFSEMAFALQQAGAPVQAEKARQYQRDISALLSEVKP